VPHSAVVDGRLSRPRRTSAYVFGSVLVALAAATPASAHTPPTGGAIATPTPKVRALQCRTACMGLTAGHAGSRVRVQGKALKRVDSVVFQGAPGGADDVSVAPLRAKKTYVDARVPRTAVSGPVQLVSIDGAESRPTAVPLIIDPTPAEPATSSDGLGIDVEVQGNRVFYGAERQAQVSYIVRDSEPVTVAVELVRLSDGVAIVRWEPGAVAPNTPQTVNWDGTAGGKVQKDGRYAFRVFATSRSGATASSSQAPAPGAPAKAPPGAPAKAPPGSFLFQRHIFPIRGAHTMGTGAAAFGGGRGHQGQDVFASCGTPLVAARGGRVKFKQYHSAAGHYIVVDGDGTGYDYAYMHLRDASLVNQGDHVYTGQPIGFVGDTGRAHGCHLHFEIWKAPGWYSGGSPIDPLPLLAAWDKAS
jgi:murein DD-endopeptidase MepM/ murein hydrolase activator NlpD